LQGLKRASSGRFFIPAKNRFSIKMLSPAIWGSDAVYVK